jgi:hemolysin activation/secretion protein
LASAQAVPALPPSADPGLQEQDRQRREKLLHDREQPAPKPAARTGEASPAEGPTFVLKRVRFSNSRHLNRDQLAAAAQPFLGREVHLQDLQALLQRVNEMYRGQGVYTAAATLPEQQVKDGTVVIQLVEGTLGQVVVDKAQYLAAPFVQRWVGDPQPGTDLDARRLEADVARFNRVNDAKLQATLRAGQDFGRTDLVLEVQEPARTSAQVFLDNYGYASSGKAELGGLVRRQKLLTDGDRSLAYLMASEGTQALSLSYNAPLDVSGWRLGASASLNRTRMIAGDFKDIDVRGGGSSLAVDSSYLAVSRDQLWLNLTAGVQLSDSSNDVRGVAVSHYRITRLNLGAPLSMTGTGWTWSFNPTLAVAHAGNQLLPEQSTSATLFTGDSSLLYRLGDRGWYGLAQASWQFTGHRSLPGALAFSVGGPASVRGYEPGQISGDAGVLATVEMHYDGWSPGGTHLDMFVFADTSEVKSINPTVHPTAAGLGASWSGWKGLGLNLSAGKGLRGVVPEQRGWHAYARVSWAF